MASLSIIGCTSGGGGIGTVIGTTSGCTGTMAVMPGVVTGWIIAVGCDGLAVFPGHSSDYKNKATRYFLERTKTTTTSSFKYFTISLCGGRLL